MLPSLNVVCSSVIEIVVNYVLYMQPTQLLMLHRVDTYFVDCTHLISDGIY
jgi:hypothetical protein